MNTSDLNLFLRIAETGSITEAARQQGTSSAAASTALKRLEQQLDVQLFIRSTRSLRITSAGEKFLFHCRQAMELLEQGIASAHVTQGKVSGELRLSVSSDLGRNIVLPWLDELMDLHPALSVRLTVGDSLSDFFADDVDLALRYGKPADSSLVAFHIATINRITCASPDYISRFGEPYHPDELVDHNCLLYKLDERLFSTWEFLRENETFRVRVRGNRITDDTDIIRRWAVAGRGIVYRSQIDIEAELNRGALIPLLTEYRSPPAQLFLLCPGRKQVSPAVIELREMLRNKCAALLR